MSNHDLRARILSSAACEMSSLIDVLDRELLENGEFPSGLWRGAYLRLDTLVSVIISGLGCDGRETDELGEEVYGVGWHRMRSSVNKPPAASAL